MDASFPSELGQWIDELGAALGLDSSAVPTALLLNVTRDVAHGVTRPAGPITTYLIGLAVAGGMDPQEATARARALVASWTAAEDGAAGE